MIAGIDYSMTSPAICIYTGDSMKDFSPKLCDFYSLSDYDISNFANFHFKQHRPWEVDEERYDHIAMWAINILDEVGENGGAIALEGYSMGSKGRVFNIAENTGVLKHNMWKRDWKFTLIPPTVVKKTATGKGNSDKEKMYEAWMETTGSDIKQKIQPNRKLGSPTSDLVDAYFICRTLAEQLH
jgi:Holliday junction resolvasome RuvABC endonuclease subunit